MGKVVAGFFSFTEITDPREHRSYNEWHQFDHLPEQYSLNGIVDGQRWVCTPACRSARVAAAPFFEPIHYLTLYLLAGPLKSSLDEFYALGQRLADLGRFHEHRVSHLAGPFLVESKDASTTTVVDARAVPHVPNRGVYVIVQHPAHPVDADVASRSHTDALLAHDGVLGVWTFATGEVHDPRSRAGDHRIAVAYLDADPVEFASQIAPIVDDWVDDGTVYAGPFETIVPRAWDWFDEPR